MSTWITYNGRELSPKDMTDRHLANVIFHCRFYKKSTAMLYSKINQETAK